MNRFALVAALLLAGLALAQVVGTFHAAGVVASDVCVHRTADGGASMEAWGRADGGPLSQGVSGAVVLTGNRQASALGLLDGPARNLLLNASAFGDGGAL